MPEPRTDNQTLDTYEQIRDWARAEAPKSREIKDALYAAGCKDRWPELQAELGRTPAPEPDPPPAVTEPQPAPVEQPATPVAPLATLEDGAVIWCDAAENKVTRVINSYGRKATFDNGGHRVGVKSGDYERIFHNTRCPDQFAGECYAVLKAVECAAEAGLSHCTIRNDRIGGFEATRKRGYIGAKYLFVAWKIADEANLAVTFDQCEGKENQADALSRRNT